MYNQLGNFQQFAIIPYILRITVSKFIFYVLIGSLSMALVPNFEGVSFYGGVGADSGLSESVNEARCRGSCLIKYTLRTSSRDDDCKKNADCYMCWSICHLLQGDSPARSSLCSDRAACFPGCQTACRFYEFLPSQNLTPPLLHDLPPLPAQMSPPRLSRDGQLAWDTPKWPEGAITPSEEVVIYIIMTNMGGQWHQHIQTSSNNIRISKKLKNSAIRVLAVTAAGLVAYNESLHWNDTDADVVLPIRVKMPIGDSPSERSTQSSAVVVGENRSHTSNVDKTQNLFVEGNERQDVEHKNNTQDVGYSNANNSADKKYSYDYVQEDSDSQPPSVTIDHSWMVNLTSKSADLLASVEVMWDVRGSGPVDYLVTWSEATGWISGHLVSQQNVADISLWRGQQYSIQIELLDQYGNSVLRSVPRSISFSSKDSAPTIKTQSPVPVLIRRSSTLPTTVTMTPGSLFIDDFMIGRRVKEQDFSSDTVWGKDDDSDVPQDISWADSEAASHNSNQFITGKRFNFPDETVVENASSKNWNVVEKKKSKDDLDSLVNSQKIKNSDSSSEESQSSSLLVWAACLGVGAVIISILIAMAVRTLKRNNTSKRQEICPNEDYLSETTTSSVNSSSITTTSQITRSLCSRPEEEQWNYESVYQVTNPPTAKIMLHRHPPPPHPPIPLSSAPHTPIHLHHPVTPHYRHNHNLYHPYHHHSHPVQPSSPIAPGRIDNASMIENYILSLDPSPVVKQVAY